MMLLVQLILSSEHFDFSCLHEDDDPAVMLEPYFCPEIPHA